MARPRACSPWTWKEVSEAAFQMPLKGRRGEGRWTLQWSINSPRGMLCSGSDLRGLTLFPGDATVSRQHSHYLALQCCSFNVAVLKLTHCTHPIDIASQCKGGAVKQEGRCSGTSEGPDFGPGSAPAAGGPWTNAFAPGFSFSYP